MKLLLNNNLSCKLVTRLQSLYADITHVALLNLATASDESIWHFAQQNNYAIVTKASDFNDLFATRGFSPKLIWLHIGNCTTDEAATLLQTNYALIGAFLQDDAFGLLTLS